MEEKKKRRRNPNKRSGSPHESPPALTGGYTDLIVTFTFYRRMGFYLIQFYIPCIVMVSLSWISFWMDRTYIGERLSLGITTILTIVFLLGSSNSTMPRVSYPKAIDWYLLGSFIFVFATLVSDLLIYRLGSNKEKERDKKEVGLVNSLLFKNACGPGRGLAEELRMMGIFHTHSFG